MLGLTEFEISNLAIRLELEIFPKYPGPITDLKAFLKDVNETLGLGLTEDQINMQIEKANKPERPEDFEFPLRPPDTQIKLDNISRAPGDESAPYLRGDNLLVMFYIDDEDTSNTWTQDQKLIARDRVVESYNWLLAKDTLGNISSILYARYPASYEVNFTNNCSNTWMDQAAQLVGYTDLEDCLRSMKSSFGVDHIGALFVISEDARSQACPYIPEWGGGYGHWDERCIIFAYRGSPPAVTMRDAGVYKHETLHLYGACDEYRSSECNSGCGQCVATYPDYRSTYLNEHNCEYCTTTPQSCTMRSGAHNSSQNDHICCWSMGQIGWNTICEDCPSEVVLRDDLDSLEVLTQLRDRVLEKNAQGKQIIEGYYAHSSELTKILLTHPGYSERAARLIYSFIPDFRRILAKGTVTIKRRKIKKVVEFLNDLSRSASPELNAFIVKMKKQILDENFLGQFGIKINR
jgi:hypothetical protein